MIPTDINGCLVSSRNLVGLVCTLQYSLTLLLHFAIPVHRSLRLSVGMSWLALHTFLPLTTCSDLGRLCYRSKHIIEQPLCRGTANINSPRSNSTYVVGLPDSNYRSPTVSHACGEFFAPGTVQKMQQSRCSLL